MSCARALSLSHMLDNDTHYCCRSLKYLKSPLASPSLKSSRISFSFKCAAKKSACPKTSYSEKRCPGYRPTADVGARMFVLTSAGDVRIPRSSVSMRDCSCTVKSCALGWHGQSTGWRLYYEHTPALFGWTTGCECTVEENNNATYFLNNLKTKYKHMHELWHLIVRI